jgi:putative transposase
MGHDIWNGLPDCFPTVQLDAFIMMPDHVHGIVTIAHGSNDDTASGPSLIRVINAFKSLSAIAINRELGRRGVAVWQRSFHDRIIRDVEEFARLCWYIEENPARWVHRTAERETLPGGRP